MLCGKGGGVQSRWFCCVVKVVSHGVGSFVVW